MVEQHRCENGIVYVMEVTNSPDPEYPWHLLLCNFNNVPLALVATKVAPNFCTWCGMSLKEN